MDEAAELELRRNKLRVFVALVVVRVLTKCKVLKNLSQRTWVKYTRQVTAKTMERLDIQDGLCPDVSSCKKVCTAVVKDLQHRLDGRFLTECALTLQDPALEEVFVTSLQKHITRHCRRLKTKSRFIKCCNKVLPWLMFIIVLTRLTVHQESDHIGDRYTGSQCSDACFTRVQREDWNRFWRTGSGQTKWI
ncbi:Hypothetical protein SMAX5B_007054 [Scophthalmus maximus]|uniref:Uncharacterized protein n=1 Tax=Scophthalmus maximus TaxID=52904 RepID=A0A2U9B0D6_SCOMX|nr:Hypothetical protein SMAX5B_007054 [Scophthalmus maximus]KAF0029051.1 hypothetical protein F2P81_018156 [Scophthalmus maximus]